MNLAVCLKRVPDTTTKLKIGPDGKLLADLTLGEGSMYHPGGIDFDDAELARQVGIVGLALASARGGSTARPPARRRPPGWPCWTSAGRSARATSPRA